MFWLADTSEYPAREGKIYCCAVLNAWNRRVIGLAAAAAVRTNLIIVADLKASDPRPSRSGSVTHSENDSLNLVKLPDGVSGSSSASKHLVGSTGTTGDRYDCEDQRSHGIALGKHGDRTEIELSMVISEWIEGRPLAQAPQQLDDHELTTVYIPPPVEFGALWVPTNQPRLLQSCFPYRVQVSWCRKRSGLGFGADD